MSPEQLHMAELVLDAVPAVILADYGGYEPCMVIEGTRIVGMEDAWGEVYHTATEAMERAESVLEVFKDRARDALAQQTTQRSDAQEETP